MKTRRGAPLWTTRVTRFAGMPSAQARIGLVLFLVFLVGLPQRDRLARPAA